jgi:predicted ATPase
MIQENTGPNERSKLLNLKISGFKSIRQESIDFDDITVFIGQNGSGKSNLVSFFSMLNMVSTGALQEYVGRSGTSDSLLYYGSRVTQAISAELSFINNRFVNNYCFRLSHASPDTLIFTEEKIKWSPVNTTLNQQFKDFGSGHKESQFFNMDTPIQPESIFKSILSHCRVYQFHDTSNDSFIKKIGNIDDDRHLKSNGGNLAAYLYSLKNNEQYRDYYDKIISRIRMILPQFGDFDLYPQSFNPQYIILNWHEKNNSDYSLGAHQTSDGSLRFMALATLLLQPPQKMPKIIIIDEPELGLHPEAVSVFCDMVRTASCYSQIILSTHSPRLIDEFDPRNILVAEKNFDNNCSSFKKLNSLELEHWLADYCLSELWEKNVLGGYV